MLHVVARAVPGTLLFRTHAEARALWDRVTRHTRVIALTLMPDHLHAKVAGIAELAGLVTAMRAFALWRHRRRGESGPVWRPLQAPTPVHGGSYARRAVRYVHLNPCRKHLVADPLTWSWSTHRDMLGLVARPVVRRVPDPAGFHRFVSGDSTVEVAGTALPEPRSDLTLSDVFASVSAITRTPVSECRRRGPARDLIACAARLLLGANSRETADLLEVEESTVRHALRRHAMRLGDPDIALVARVAGDPRFAALRDGDLRRDPAWRAAGYGDRR